MNPSSPSSSLLLASLLLPFLPVYGSVKMVSKTMPRYGQRGTTIEVEIQGASLDNPREIIFFKPGIRAFDLKLKEKPPSLQKLAHGGYIDAAITCKFEIAADCPPGEYPFRLLTATELSHLGTFHVSPFRTIEEGQERNHSLERAMPVTPNVTINGLLGYEPQDYFRVPVKAGQSLAVELLSVRISDRNYGGSTYDLSLIHI